MGAVLVSDMTEMDSLQVSVAFWSLRSPGKSGIQMRVCKGGCGFAMNPTGFLFVVWWRSDLCESWIATYNAELEGTGSRIHFL